MLVELFFGVTLILILLQYLTQSRPQNFPPGPNGIPLLGYLPFLSLPVPESLAKLSQKYGKIYSIFFGNYPIVFLHDLKLTKEAFKDERFAGRPPLEIFRDRSFGDQRGIIFSTGRLWNEQRRFALRNLRDFGFGKGSMENLIIDEVVDLVSEFKKELNAPVCLDMRFNSAVLNSLWHIIAGERYKHGDPRLEAIIKKLSEEFAKQSAGGPIFFFAWFAKLFPELSGYNTFKRVFDSTYEFLSCSINEHRKTIDYDHPRDLIDAYLKEIKFTYDDTSSFFKDEGERNLLVTLLDLFAAGADTTSVSLGWAVLYLILNPNIQKKLHNEIDDVIGSSRLPSLSDRPNMPYMEAFITETFRHSSIATLGGIHSTTETVEFHGYTLPKDTIILSNSWYIHHNKEYWGDPEKFRPERFITSDGKFRPDEALLPFSTGKRVCIGESLARDEMFLFLTGILQQIQFEVDKNGPMPTMERKEAIIVRSRPYKVIMTDRHSST